WPVLLERASGGHQLRRITFRSGTTIHHRPAPLRTALAGQRTLSILLHQPKQRGFRSPRYDQRVFTGGTVECTGPADPFGRRPLPLHGHRRFQQCAALLPVAAAISFGLKRKRGLRETFGHIMKTKILIPRSMNLAAAEVLEFKARTLGLLTLA